MDNSRLKAILESRQTIARSSHPLLLLNRKKCLLLSDLVTDCILELSEDKGNLESRDKFRRLVSGRAKKRLKMARSMPPGSSQGYGSLIFTILLGVLLEIIIKKLIKRWWPELLESRN